MGITTFLVLVVIGVIAFLVAGSQISAFVNDTLGTLGETIREDEIKLPPAENGEIVCDMFVTANWQERGTLVLALNPLPILFFEAKDVDGGGVGFDIDYQNCKIFNGGFQFNSLLDFLGTADEAQPLDFIIPDIPVFDDPYILSWVLVDPDTGKERKVLHYQEVEYIVPQGVFEFRYEQKLVFRELVPDHYILKIIPEKNARFFNHDDGEVFLHSIPDPT